MQIASATFDRSAPDLAACPDESLPEFAFICGCVIGRPQSVPANPVVSLTVLTEAWHLRSSSDNGWGGIVDKNVVLKDARHHAFSLASPQVSTKAEPNSAARPPPTQSTTVLRRTHARMRPSA